MRPEATVMAWRKSSRSPGGSCSPQTAADSSSDTTAATELPTSCEIIRTSFSYAAFSELRSSSVTSSRRKKLRGKPRSKNWPRKHLSRRRPSSGTTRDSPGPSAASSSASGAESSGNVRPAAFAGASRSSSPAAGFISATRPSWSRVSTPSGEEASTLSSRKFCSSSRSRSSRSRSLMRLNSSTSASASLCPTGTRCEPKSRSRMSSAAVPSRACETAARRSTTTPAASDTASVSSLPSSHHGRSRNAATSSSAKAEWLAAR